MTFSPLTARSVAHHNKFAPKGEGLDVRGWASVALAELAAHRDELRAESERADAKRKTRRGSR